MRNKFQLLKYIASVNFITRFLISVFIALIIYTVVPKLSSLVMEMLLLWISFSCTYVLLSWITIFMLPINEIKKKAEMEDGSKIFVFFIILFSSAATLITVLVLLVNSRSSEMNIQNTLPIIIPSMMISWVLVHTQFIFHYAHLYYQETSFNALEFPGNEEPDYFDFAYYSFTIGFAFQVSDVSIASKRIRKITLIHSMISFGINTFELALMVNIIAGLIK